MGRLEELTKQLDYIWEDMIYDPCTDLPTIFEVDNIDEQWLAYLGPLLAFTDDLTFDASEEEMRRMFSSAVPYWNAKPSELGVINYAIRMVTGNRFKAANWFDFRMQEDKTCITEELEDFDPVVVGFESPVYTGSLGIIPTLLQFTLTDLTIDFANAHQFKWLEIISDPSNPGNQGLYEIDYLIPGSKTGYVKVNHHFSAISLGGNLEWKIWGYMGEFVTEVRLVDQGVGDLALKNVTSSFTVGQRALGASSGAYGVITAISSDDVLSLRSIVGRFEVNEAVSDPLGGAGTVLSKLDGVLNRELLEFLMGGRTVRPFSERIDVVYINFLDRFLTPGDLDQWEVSDSTLVSVPSPAGPCTILQGGRIQSDDAYQDYWEDQVTAWKIQPIDSDTAVHLTFMGTDASNHYYVLVDYDTKQVSLWKNVAGTPTQLGSTITLTYLKQGVSDVIRVDALDEASGGTRIRVKVNGETELDENDAAGAFTAGRVGVYALDGDVKVELVEVNDLPCEVSRVGPNP